MSESATPMQPVEGDEEISAMEMMIETAERLFPYMKGKTPEERFENLMAALLGIEDEQRDAVEDALKKHLIPEDPEEVLEQAFFSPYNDFIDTARRLGATVSYDPRKDKVHIILPDTGEHHRHHHRSATKRLVRQVKRTF